MKFSYEAKVQLARQYVAKNYAEVEFSRSHIYGKKVVGGKFELLGCDWVDVFCGFHLQIERNLSATYHSQEAA
jgi:hypothetical protein